MQDDATHDSDDGTASPSHGRSRASSSVNPASPAHRPVTLTPTSTSSTFASKLSKSRNKDRSNTPFNLHKEKDNMTKAIANSSMASINLLNGLQLVNRENERVSENQEVLRRFQTCKKLRKEILRYIQHVESDEWIGSLVNANDELVKALTAYEIMDRSVDDDSDSDAWEHAPPEAMLPQSGSGGPSDAADDPRGLSLQEDAPPKPPRPGNIAMPSQPAFPSKPSAPTPAEEEEDEDNPFGDSNAAPTPSH